jgi:DNA-binding MarR family transcriptional regulator
MAMEFILATGQLTRRLRAESASRELTWSQLAVIARLDRDGPTTSAELARAEVVKPQSMGSTLATLEEEGIVERRPHPTDGRQILFALTAKGESIRREAVIASRAWFETAFAKFDPAEQEILISALPLIRRLGES